MFKFVVPIVAMLVANMPASIPDVLYDAKLSEAETVEEASCGSGVETVEETSCDSGVETVEEASCGSGVETAGEVSGSSGDNSVRIGQIYLPNGMLEKYAMQYWENSDMAGYIYLPNGIEYPVMFTPYNQNYYADHNFEKAESREGLPFLNRYSVFGERGISLMYGHHLKSGRGFTVLKDYLEDIEDKVIRVDTLYSEQEYEVVAAALTSLDEPFNYYEYVASLNRRKFEAWKESFEPYCIRGTLSALEYDDVILELSTCYYQKENGRLVVILKACK